MKIVLILTVVSLPSRISVASMTDMSFTVDAFLLFLFYSLYMVCQAKHSSSSYCQDKILLYGSLMMHTSLPFQKFATKFTKHCSCLSITLRTYSTLSLHRFPAIKLWCGEEDGHVTH